jgi:hypothetical protein
MSVRRVIPLLSLLAVLSPAGAARADELVGAVARATPVVADAGYGAWRGDDGRLVVRQGDGPAHVTNLRPPASAVFDVGVRRAGGAQVVWAEGCSTRTHRCTVRGATLTAVAVRAGRMTARVVARIPYRGGGSPAVAVDGARLAHTERVGGCDVPYAGARRLDRGHCARITQLDVGDGWVAALAWPTATYRATEARLIRWTGGPSRLKQRESQGEESNYIGSVSLDRGALFTARGGIRQANVLTRWPLTGGARSDVRAFVSLQGGFARDAGRTYYAQLGGSSECPCLVVAGQDPFTSARRALAPELALTVAPQPVFVGDATSAVVSLTQRSVTRTAVTGRVPVAGVPVELLMAVPTDPRKAPPAPRPTGARATTGADGTAAIPIPGAAQPFRFLAAVTRPGDAAGVPVPTVQPTYVQTFARMTATATRLADGRLRVTGTISPALPGRKVRLDRRLDRICNTTTPVPDRILTPSQAQAPAGCFERFTQDPVTTALVGADGATFALTASASSPAGTYRVALDFGNGALVFPGESAPFAAP